MVSVRIFTKFRCEYCNKALGLKCLHMGSIVTEVHNFLGVIIDS
jgi:hypothetical protein